MVSFSLEIIKELPKLISYFVPGALFIVISQFICSKKNTTYEYFIFKSLIISYLMILISNGVFTVLNLESVEFLDADIFTKIFPIIISIISSYLLSIFYMSLQYESFLKFLKINRTIHDSFWTDVLDCKHGTYITVYLKEEKLKITGIVKRHEEKEDNNYLSLAKYEIYDCEGKIIKECTTDDRRILVNTRDIFMCELIYNPESKKMANEKR